MSVRAALEERQYSVTVEKGRDTEPPPGKYSPAASVEAFSACRFGSKRSVAARHDPHRPLGFRHPQGHPAWPAARRIHRLGRPGDRFPALWPGRRLPLRPMARAVALADREPVSSGRRTQRLRAKNDLPKLLPSARVECRCPGPCRGLVVHGRRPAAANVVCRPSGSRPRGHSKTRGRTGFDRMARGSDCVSWLVGWPR
jgi:hypothetical protein